VVAREIGQKTVRYVGDRYYVAYQLILEQRSRAKTRCVPIRAAVTTKRSRRI